MKAKNKYQYRITRTNKIYDTRADAQFGLDKMNRWAKKKGLVPMFKMKIWKQKI